MPDYLVTLESAWYIKEAKSLDDAIGIAISEAGKRLNPSAKFVEVEAGMLACRSASGSSPVQSWSPTPRSWALSWR